MKIGMIGLGHMGGGIAANIVAAGHNLTVWNRSPEKAQPLAEKGAIVACSPRAVAEAGDIIFTMLADDAALESVLVGEDGLLMGMAPEGLHISLSTISVAMAEQLAMRHSARGQYYLSAPVFGRPDAAAAGRLNIIVSGPSALIDRATPILSAIGIRIFPVGESPSAANIVKLSGNFMILSAIEAMGEAMAFAVKGGVDQKILIETLTEALFDCRIYRNYGAMLAEQRFEPAGFTAPLGLKDMRLVSEAAEANRVPMPLLGLLRDHLLQTIAIEGNAVDWSAIGRTIGRNAGL